MEPFIENELMQQQYIMQGQAQAQAQAQAHAQASQLLAQSQGHSTRDSVGGQDQGQGQPQGQGPLSQHGSHGSIGMGQGSLGMSQSQMGQMPMNQMGQMPMNQMGQVPHQSHQNQLHHHGQINQNIGQSHPMSSNMAPPLPLHTPYKKDFDLLNPSNPSIATAQALLAHDQASQQRYLLHPQYPHMQQVGQYLPPPFPMEVRYDEMMHNQQHQQHNQQPPHQGQRQQQHQDQRHLLTLLALQPPGLVAPIPPLHIQQQIVNSETSVKPEPTPTPTDPQTAPDQMLRSACLRCKKEFDQPIIIPQSTDSDGGQTKYLAEPKIFKLCQHCRDLQRQRSRRWQKKTKDKQGACRRCGSDIPPEEQKFVLCPSCRQNLRKRKANRAAQGKCVHCLGPLDALIITGDDKKDSEEKRDRSKLGNYKVCERCRENDKIRRTNLEKMGNCNRCAKALDPMDIGKHKVCANCRSRKKKLNQNINNTSNPGVKVPEIMSHHPGYAVLPQQGVGQPVGLMHDQQAAMAMMTPGSANYTPQQYAQAQYNQAVMQQQAFNQALSQHPQM